MDAGAAGRSTVALEGNLTGASPGWFVDFEKGDLHLARTAQEAIGHAAPLGGVVDDFDGHPRAAGMFSDIGAVGVQVDNRGR